MESYKSDSIIIDYNIDVIYSKLSDPRIFKEHLDKNIDHLPDEAREHLEKVKFEDDGISVESPMGMLKLSVCESVAPTMVKYTAQSSPVPFGLTINLSPIDEDHTQSVTELNIELPMMLRAMVGSKLSDGAKKLGEMIAKLPYGAM
ncbi:MAG: hypothetical protein IJG81_10155 [Muribaculaceae bacterium]|nr:hypothetical protein [Muribaculaceae bacterium]